MSSTQHRLVQTERAVALTADLPALWCKHSSDRNYWFTGRGNRQWTHSLFWYPVACFSDKLNWKWPQP